MPLYLSRVGYGQRHCSLESKRRFALSAVAAGGESRPVPARPDLIARGRSLRLEMLQVARLARTVLGDSAELVTKFIDAQFTPEGAARDRGGRPDLYYTIFALAAEEALQMESAGSRAAALTPYLERFGDGAGLDFIHLGALARCWAAAKTIPPGR